MNIELEMGFQSTRSQEMNLVLSTDAKPRLKWTPELHQRFIDAVIQLGGADKATPKSLMRVMGVPGLTLYHLKSHLQKFRLGRNQLVECSDEFNVEDCMNSKAGLKPLDERSADQTLNPVESVQIAQAIQIQLEVQRKLHEQIEVQKHLQLRIEAQGKYLQKVLKKAQETLSQSASSFVGAELSQLVSMVSSGCPISSLSEITESGALSLESPDQYRAKGQGCSVESSLTSSGTSGMGREDKEPKVGEVEEANHKILHEPLVLPLLDQPWKNGLTGQLDDNRKRRGSSIFEEICGRDQSSSKRLATACREKMGSALVNQRPFGELDLNSKCESDLHLGHIQIDLNSEETDPLNGEESLFLGDL